MMDATILRDAYLACLRTRQDSARRRVKLALAKKQLSLAQIAKVLGVSTALVSLILSGGHKGYEHRPAIARALGLAESAIWTDGGRRAPTRRDLKAQISNFKKGGA